MDNEELGEILKECLSELASAAVPVDESASNKLITNIMKQYDLPVDKLTGRASLTKLCTEYINSLPKDIHSDKEFISLLHTIGAAYNNFNLADSTQERDMKVFRKLIAEKFGKVIASDLIKKSKISNTKRTLAHIKESKEIRNERHNKPTIYKLSTINRLITEWSKCFDAKGQVPDEICLLTELCTGARAAEVVEFSTFSVEAKIKTVTMIKQVGCLKQGEKSASVVIIKPLLLGVDGKRLIDTLMRWRSTNRTAMVSVNARLNYTLQKYLPGATTHTLRALYAHTAYDTIVKKGLLPTGVTTLNKFLQDSLGHHSFEIGLSYLHVVLIDDL